ncbi:uncharacterized protein LOC143621583 [Bidens hawaiensis]|uniref:uncharacterized protein LOC143621583 n=1 Tax=Bidens hawaiensis TaxID=980011 RepID=UPI00404AEDB4
MACINMQVKNETQGGSFMGPRISFSSDSNHHENYTYTEAPVSSDFEFSVPSFSSNAADEVFFKAGKPLMKDQKVVTLRDELLSGHDDDDNGWWREKFGLRKGQSGRSEHKMNLGGLETIDEAAKIKPGF